MAKVRRRRREQIRAARERGMKTLAELEREAHKE